MGLKNRYQYDDLLIRNEDPYARAKYEIILGWLTKHRARKILNAGCGSGEFCLLLAQNGYQVVGFDPDGDYIDLARKNDKFRQCRFEVAKIENFRVRDKFDAVVATDVLEHIKDDRGAWELLVRMVKPGGLVVITVPAGQYLFGFHDMQLGHFRRYSKASLLTIKPKGLEIINIRYFGFLLIPVAWMVSKMIKKSYPVAKSSDNVLLNMIFEVEKRLRPPWGTSLLFLGEKSHRSQRLQQP